MVLHKPRFPDGVLRGQQDRLVFARGGLGLQRKKGAEEENEDVSLLDPQYSDMFKKASYLPA